MRTFTIITDDVLQRRDLTPLAKLLYGRLRRYAHKTGECHPKQQTLAEILGTSLRTVKRAFKELRKIGLIEVQRHRLAATYKIGQVGTSRSAILAPEIGQVGTSEAPYPLYEDYNWGDNCARASATARRPPSKAKTLNSQNSQNRRRSAVDEILEAYNERQRWRSQAG